MAFRCFLIISCALILLSSLTFGQENSRQSKGSLIVAGGGKLPDRIYKRFVELAGGKEAKIVVIPQASEKENAGVFQKELFEKGPHKSVAILDLEDRKTALDLIGNATGIWISGGMQHLLMERLRKVDGAIEAIHKQHELGGVIGGSSAGAAVMSEIMIAGDERPLETGLALWPEAIVDQHFSARKRMQRSFNAVSKNPDQVGIGIDESTAVLVHPDGRLEVIGERSVTVIDARESRNATGALTLENVKVDRHRENSSAFRITPVLFQKGENAPIAIVVHGGAGSVDKKWLTEELKQQHFEDLEKAVAAGMAILEAGGSSLDAVEGAIVILEDSPLFNAGKGAVFTRAETNELDASIMEGSQLDAGAVGGVTRIKNPIRAARAVMEGTPHVMLAGEGADEFAEQKGLKMVEPDYFHTDRRLQQLREKLKKEKAGRAEVQSVDPGYLGTVGAVALDREGNIAAGTSTGGLTAKKFGRIGDSPIVGAGTYAKNGIGGISCTGHGEFFIRHAVAHDIVARSDYKKISLDAAASEVVEGVLVKAKGSGGVIGVNGNGNVIMRMNTESMWRSWQNSAGEKGTALLRNE